MKGFLCFLLGLILGVAGHWYLTQSTSRGTAAQVKEEVHSTATNLGQSFKKTFDADKINDELARTGRVIREKAKQAGDVVADATANARITGTIKTKLVQDSGLAAFKIDVDTTDGVVTLSGTVSSPEEIARAVDLALETDGVYRVVSTLQVKPPERPSSS
jgi:osmotically-inducible protein OsmY